MGVQASLPPGFRQSPALCYAGVSLPAWLPLLFPTIPARVGLGRQLPLGTGETMGPVDWEQGSYPCFRGGASAEHPPASAGGLGPILGQEDPLEEVMATHSRILAWRKSHGQRSLQSMGSKKSQTQLSK